MVVGKIVDIELDQSVIHKATDWEISTDSLFKPSATVCSSLGDSNNLTDIVFNEILDPTIKYYGRARLLLSTGYTIWGNIHVFVPQAIEELNLDISIPSNISIPRITLSDPADYMPVIGFTLYASDFSVNGDAVHKSTTWLLENSDGIIIWKSIMDNINKEKIHVYDRLLDSNKLYRVRVIFHSSSNDVSQVATKTFVTCSNKAVNILTKLYEVDYTSDLNINILNKIGANSLKAELYHIGSNEYNKVWETTNTVDIFNLTIPSTVLKDSTLYILKVKTDIDKDFTTELFTTY